MPTSRIEGSGSGNSIARVSPFVRRKSSPRFRQPRHLRVRYTEAKAQFLLLIRSVFLAVIFLSSASAQPIEQTELNGNINLFSVMVALDAAGFDAGSASDHPLRAAIRPNIPPNLQVVSELKSFVSTHRKPDPGADLAQYISFALASGEPPDFRPRFQGLEVPPDVDKLEGFQGLMQRFFKDANLQSLWQRSQEAIGAALQRYQEPVSRVILEANGYLRNPTTGYMGRRFLVYVDLIGPANQVHTRSYKDDYFIVVTPSAEPQVEDIRHAYFHYLLDPLATKIYGKLDKKRGVIDYAQGAPALDENYKTDFLLLATECLIKAVESRLDKRPAGIQEALREGFVLTPHFAEQLPGYEKQESAMRLYFAEMVDAIDLKKEERRLEQVTFASSRPVRKASAPAVTAPSLSAAEQSLESADKFYTGRDFEKARESYMRVLKQTEERTTHSRAYYGLGRIAALERNPELAEQLFRKTLESTPDPHTRSWTEVFLGRLYENSSNPGDAAAHYKAALSVDGAPPGAKKAAEQGLQKLSTNQN